MICATPLSRYYAILSADPVEAPVVRAVDGVTPLAPGVEVRFLKPAVPAEKATIAATVEHVDRAHPTLRLAAPVIVGSPHGHVFAAPTRITAPLKGGPAAVAKVLHKPDRAAPWAELPPEQVTQHDPKSCSITVDKLAGCVWTRAVDVVSCRSLPRRSECGRDLISFFFVFIACRYESHAV